MSSRNHLLKRLSGLLVLVMFAGIVSPLMAQDPQTVSLHDAIALALRNNLTIQNEQFGISASRLQTREAKSALLPQVDLSGQYKYYEKLPSQYAPASAFGGPEGEYSKITLALPQNVEMTVQSSLNLYNHSVFVGLRAARTLEEIAALKYEVTREDIVYQVSSTYYTIQILEQNLQRLESNIQNLQKTAAISESLTVNEIASANHHNRLLINLDNLKNQYENQRLSRDKNLELLRYLVSQGTVPITVEAFDDVAAATFTIDAETQMRKELLLQQQQLRLSELERKSVRAGYFPTLTAGMSLGYTSYNDEFAPTRQLNNDWINSQAFWLTLRVPLFDGFQKYYSLRQKQIVVQQQANRLSLMRANSAREFRDAQRNYLSNVNQLDNSKRSLALAEQLFASAQTDFDNGITTLTDLLNAQDDLTLARNNYTTALLNVKLAELETMKANGTLVQKLTQEISN